MNSHLEPLLAGAKPHSAKALCVLTHGRTQSPEMMLDAVVQHLDVRDVLFVLPRALNNSWYSAKAVDALTRESHAELTHSLDYLAETVESSRALTGTTLPLVMAGFSQGACLTLEYALRFGSWAGAMVCFTGCRVGQASDPRPHAELADLPVYLTGSDDDPWIPVSAYAEASAALGLARARLRTDLFPGRAHTVSPPELAALGSMLTRLTSGQSAFGEAFA